MASLEMSVFAVAMIQQTHRLYDSSSTQALHLESIVAAVSFAFGTVAGLIACRNRPFRRSIFFQARVSDISTESLFPWLTVIRG
jgi:hypothetical protein